MDRYSVSEIKCRQLHVTLKYNYTATCIYVLIQLQMYEALMHMIDLFNVKTFLAILNNVCFQNSNRDFY